MALIICPECGASFSEYSESCPKCGLATNTAKTRIAAKNGIASNKPNNDNPNIDSEAIFKSAQKLFDAKKYEQAYASIEHLLSVSPNPEFTELKIQIEDKWLEELKQNIAELLDQKKYPLAMQFLQKAQKINQNDLIIQNQLAHIEKLKKHKKKFNNWCISACILVFLCVIGYIGYSIYRKNELRKEQESIKQEQIDSIKAEAEAEKKRICEEAEAKVKKERQRAIDDSYYYSNEKYVVITGKNLRLRYGPTTDADTYKWEDGTNKHPKVGEKLEYLGETDEWYKVLYDGLELWVSKQFSHIY